MSRFRKRLAAIGITAAALVGGMLAVPTISHAAPVAPSAATVSAAFPRLNYSGKVAPSGREFIRPAGHDAPVAVKPIAERTMSAQISSADTPAPECPPTVTCTFVPAAFSQNGSDPTDWGNYDIAQRPTDFKITHIVIHNTEGTTAASAITAFQDPLYYVSAHYIVDTDGTIIQMVRLRDIAWAAGNYWLNTHSINIEHVGMAGTGALFTAAQAKASATLVRWLAAQFNIPLDRGHIIGHDNVSSPNTANLGLMHMDPGPYWNWQRYMKLLGAPVLPAPGIKLLTVAPNWSTNIQPVTGCFPDTTDCASGDPQPTSILYVYSTPSLTSPLVTDLGTGVPGDTGINNPSARVYFGQKYAPTGNVKPVKGAVWVEVWYGNQRGWIFSPLKAPTLLPATGEYATVNADNTPVYGRAYPDSLAHPLPYVASAGQRFAVMSDDIPTDYYDAPVFNDPSMYNIVTGAPNEYVMVEFAQGRFGMLKRADVTLAA